ncbi:MAG: hypothetical protein MR675_05050 [Lachnospira sp.]|nr:hypothetical protein [Lachnospira sp.]MDD5828364.1 hypothetical protein [Lachnospira sp.]
MKKLLKIEFERAFKNKMFFVSIIIGTFIAALHTYYKVWTEIGAIETILGYGKYSGIQLTGLYMKWMGTSSSSYSFLYYFVMPLLTALPYSVSILMDVKKNYINNIFTRIDKKKYYKAKLLTQFVTGGVIAAFPLVLSLVVSAMIVPAFKPIATTSQYNFDKTNVFGDLFYDKPLLVALIVILFAFVGFGLINCIAYVFADLISNRFMVALTPFMVYFLHYIVSSSLNRSGPMEYITGSRLRYSELKYMIIDVVVLVILIIVSYFARSRRKDAI